MKRRLKMTEKAANFGPFSISWKILYDLKELIWSLFTPYKCSIYSTLSKSYDWDSSESEKQNSPNRTPLPHMRLWFDLVHIEFFKINLYVYCETFLSFNSKWKEFHLLSIEIEYDKSLWKIPRLRGTFWYPFIKLGRKKSFFDLYSVLLFNVYVTFRPMQFRPTQLRPLQFQPIAFSTFRSFNLNCFG